MERERERERERKRKRGRRVKNDDELIYINIYY